MFFHFGNEILKNEVHFVQILFWFYPNFIQTGVDWDSGAHQVSFVEPYLGYINLVRAENLEFNTKTVFFRQKVGWL